MELALHLLAWFGGQGQRKEIKELRLGIFSPIIVSIWNLVAHNKYFINLLLLQHQFCIHTIQSKVFALASRVLK